MSGSITHIQNVAVHTCSDDHGDARSRSLFIAKFVLIIALILL